MFEAVRASCSIPSLVSPVKKNNKILVDGGINNPLPFSIVRRTKNDILIGVNLNSFNEDGKQTSGNYFYDYYKYLETISNYLPKTLREYIKKSNERVGGYMDISSRTFQIMQDKIIQDSIKNHSPDIIFEIPRNTCNMFNFMQAKKLIEIGRNIAIKKLTTLSS